MALIGQIRKNSWLLVVAIGLALAAFIIMDMSAGDKSLFGSSQNVAGSINGENIDWNEFNRAESILYGNSGGDVFQRRASLWDYMVGNKLVEAEAKEMGLGVSKQELLDLQFSNDNRKLSPIIIQRYSTPGTRQVDRAQLNEIKQAIETRSITNPDFKTRWAYQEKEIISSSLQSKLENLVRKAVYTPDWMAEMMHSNNEQKVNFEYVKIPFDNIDDSQINLTDADYTAYLNENKAQFKQDEETRKVDYVTFKAEASDSDQQKILAEITTLAGKFATTDDDSLFVESNYGVIGGTYEKKSFYSNVYADTLFNVAPGTVVGPYKDGNAYVAVKVLDRKVMPDSVRARHILLNAATPANFQTLDSLKNLIEAGTHRFDSLAVKFSQGPSNVKGGDLGFSQPGKMVQQFDQLIFHTAKKGELNIIATQFGLHLVEVTDYKYINNEEGVKVAMLSQNIIPSEETISQVNNKVLEFVSNNRTINDMIKAADADPTLTVETSPSLKVNDYNLGSLGGGQTSRDIIKWAFEEASVGEVSSQVYIYQNPVDFYDEKFVVAGLRSIQPAGMPSVDYVREDITSLVKNYKKGQMIQDQIKGKGLTDISGVFSDATVETASDVSFNANAIPNVGAEAKVIATAFATTDGQSSQPIIGKSGVFVVKPIAKTTVAAASNLPEVRRSTNTTMRNKVNGRLIVEGFKKNADIDDQRSRLY